MILLLMLGVSYEAVAMYLQRLFIFQGYLVLLLLLSQIFKQNRAMQNKALLYAIPLQCTKYSQHTAGV